jgi:aryl-alcohol dehydrogenase-like predicted oxidoreductase
MLTGKYRRREAPAANSRFVTFPTMAQHFGTARNFDLVDRLHSFATSREHTLLELAVSWLLGCPAVSSVIAGATSVAQVRQNVGAGGWLLSPQELAEVHTITGPAREL